MYVINKVRQRSFSCQTR